MSLDAAARESALDFFMRSMGRHLVALTGNAVADAQRALSGGHVMAKGGAPQRIAAGWAVLTERGATLQFKLAATGINYSEATRFEAWLDCLDRFDGQPVMLLEFDKKPIPLGNLTRTFDLRHVAVCGPKGVETFDWTRPPEPGVAGRVHRTLWKLKTQRDEGAGDSNAAASPR